MSKQKTKKIQDFDRLYCFLRYFVDFALKVSYRSVLKIKSDSIPKNAAIIYAPNHSNALMDALVILTIDRSPKVFVARADIFRNRQLAKIFSFLKIMPIMRQRDGLKEVKKNQEIISKSADVLKDKIPFCIFPEGTHQTKYSLLPISKGIFRIAFQAKALMPETPLFIVPVGLRYGDFFRFRSTLRVQMGDPINVGAFIEEHAECTQQEQMNEMKDLLTERLHSCTLYIPNDEHYDATYEICNIAQPYEMEQLQSEWANRKKHQLERQFIANQNTLKRIAKLKERDPEKAHRLMELGNEAYALRVGQGIDLESVSEKKSVLYRLAEVLLLFITLPYTITASIFASPLSLLCEYLFTILKDPAFRNSVRFIALLFVWPLLMILYSIVAYSLLPWQWALPATLFLLPAPIVAHDLWYRVRRNISDMKFRREKKLRKVCARIEAMLQSL